MASHGGGEAKVELPGVSPSSSSASSPSGSRRSQGGGWTDSSAAPMPGDDGESPQVRDSHTRSFARGFLLLRLPTRT
jgi:hypothetical protein